MFYFGTDRRSRKGRNLATNPGLVVHLESGDDVVILEGVAEEVADPSLLAHIGDVYAAKYGLSGGIPPRPWSMPCGHTWRTHG